MAPWKSGSGHGARPIEFSDWSPTSAGVKSIAPCATRAPSRYSDAVPASPSTTADTLTHWFAVTPQEPDCTSRSTPPDFSPTSGARPEPQLREAKKYPVAEESLPMFHRKWKPLIIAAEALTSAVTVADSSPTR